jgi:signal transduction histidine kinase
VTIKRLPGLTFLAGALLLLLPALAVLQFRWVGQLSEAELDRMGRNVDIAALQFRDSFGLEVVRAWGDLQVSAATARDNNWERYAERYEQWAANSDPSLVRAVYIVVAEGGQPIVRQWYNEKRAFISVPWPEVLLPWKDDFAADLEDFTAVRPPTPQDQRPPRFQRQATLIRGGLRGADRRLGTAINPDIGSRRLTTELAFGHTVLELNLPYIKERLLPELVQRHFTHGEGDSYRVAVIDWDNPAEVIYRSDANAPTYPDQADARQGIFPRLGGGGPPPPRDQRAAPPERRGAQNDDRRGAQSDAGIARSSAEEFPGRWRLLVQHESGSLNEAVAGARRRNLALSFGVLLLLSVSIVLLTLASRKAQRLAEQQIEFVAGVSHELRTPVAVIRSAAENLSQGVVGSAERVKRYGQMIEGEARRLGEMVERVLQYAGIESGLGYGARTTLAPAEIIDAAVDSAIPLLGGESVDVQRSVPETLPAVTGDAAALRSAVQNLVANAVKYGGSDRWVGIRAEHVRDHRRSEVRITVSDHGTGIPASDLPHIFDPFYRGGDALARQIHGNGLGLSLVKRIVAAHGGRVTVETRAGAGSSFTIALPAAEPAAASTSVASEVRAAAHP